MDKTTAIVLLVVLALVLILLIRFLFPSIKSYVIHMPKGIFILLALIIIVVIIFLIVYLTTDDPSGMPFMGHKEDTPVVSEEQKEMDKMMAEGIVISGNTAYLGDDRADMSEIVTYIDQRIKEKKEVIIVDDYASSKVYHEIEDICKEKNVTPKYVKKEN